MAKGQLLHRPWSGYVFGLVAVLITTALLLAVLPGRPANASALYALPVLLTASNFGRLPSLSTAFVAFAAFDWLFAEDPKLDASHWPTLVVLIVVGLVAGQLATMLQREAASARQREREALALYEMARLVPSSTLEVDRLHGWILDQLKTIVGYDAVAIVLHRESDPSVVVEYRGPLPREHVVGQPASPDGALGQLLEAVRERRGPIILERISESALAFELKSQISNDPPAAGDKTELAVPLLVKGRVIGVQILLRSAEQPYTARDAELAVVFAQQAAVAIENADLYREARDRLNEIVGLQHLGAMLLQEHDFDRLLHAIGVQLMQITSAEGVALALLNEREQAFDVRAAVGVEASSNLGARIPLEGSLAGQAIRTDHALRSNDAQNDPRGYQATLVRSHTHSILSVPMRTRQRVVGAISIYNKHGATGFSDRDEELATLVAQQAAVAIENARLYEETRGRAALEERQRLARELHDSVSQALYGIALNASAAEELFASSPDRARRLLNDVLRLAEAGLTEMRALIFELRPESLEQEGLVGALEKQVASVQARHGVHSNLEVTSEPDLPPMIKEALYRVVQEALHNIVKHARANTVTVRLEVPDGEVRLVVADDGRGFNPREEYPGHLGLRSMRERLAAVGGTVEIESAPGAGTRLTARVPLARAATPD